MAVTLAQAAVLSDDDLQRGVLEVFVQESPVLDRIPLMNIEGNAYAYNKELALPGVAFRSVNEAYVESTGTFVQASESLVILGGDADVDRFIVQTRGNLNDQRAAQTRMKVKAASYKFQDEFFNGDITVDPKGFDGLRKRLTGDQVITAATNGAAINTDDSTRHTFFDNLDLLMAQVPDADVIYANRSVHALIRSAGRQIGGTELVQEDITNKRVLTWQGIPVLDPGNAPDGSPILPQDETTGTSDVTSSIYAVKFGNDESDGGVTGLTNGGVNVRDLGEIDDKPVYRTRIEFYCGLATFGGNAAARLTGVIAA